MTFAEFQASRAAVQNLGAAMADASLMDRPGYIYAGGLCWIEKRNPHLTPEARKRGAYYLLLERDDWISDDLTGLEARLYAWAQSEGIT
jgi:hypothetical protein